MVAYRSSCPWRSPQISLGKRMINTSNVAPRLLLVVLGDGLVGVIVVLRTPSCSYLHTVLVVAGLHAGERFYFAVVLPFSQPFRAGSIHSCCRCSCWSEAAFLVPHFWSSDQRNLSQLLHQCYGNNGTSNMGVCLRRPHKSSGSTWNTAFNKNTTSINCRSFVWLLLMMKAYRTIQ